MGGKHAAQYAIAPYGPAGTFTLGQELVSRTRISRLTGGWHEAINQPIAGEFYAFGIDGQGVSAKQLETVKTRMELVKTKLENQQFEGITKESLIGDMLHAAVLGYFAANDVNLKILNRGEQVLSYRLPSFGTFSTALDPIYSFGIPRQVKMSGIMVDMDAVVNSLWAKNNDANLTKTIGQQIGMMTSALEHRIPELFFTNEQNPGEAVSAVKALAVASTQGQRIYQVTSANVNSVLSVLNISSEVKNEIRNSVAVGKVVTVSQSNITVGGWTGVGYIVSDPETGSGAYRISGGGNGGHYDDEYWSKYIHFISCYGIHLDLIAVIGLLLFGSIPKSWVGFEPLLGSTNPLTSVLRGVFASPLGKMIIMRALLIPMFTVIGTLIGFYNVTILIEGLFYAIYARYYPIGSSFFAGILENTMRLPQIHPVENIKKT